MSKRLAFSLFSCGRLALSTSQRSGHSEKEKRNSFFIMFSGTGTHTLWPRSGDFVGPGLLENITAERKEGIWR